MTLAVNKMGAPPGIQNNGTKGVVGLGILFSFEYCPLLYCGCGCQLAALLALPISQFIV